VGNERAETYLRMLPHPARSYGMNAAFMLLGRVGK
jgi:hypothetical protein